MNMNNFVYIVKCVLGMVKSPTKRDVLIGLRFNDSSKGLDGNGFGRNHQFSKRGSRTHQFLRKYRKKNHILTLNGH